eukprot:14925491-Alexandrium_andersonii.AAC.1
MSASLVGSEMCIRDSLGSLQSPPEPSGLLSKRGFGTLCDPSAGPAGAVSYTHLTLPTICSV